MASLYDLKPQFQSLLRPPTRGLAAAGVTANQVTLAALLLSIAGGACLAMFPTERWPLLVVPGLLFVRMGLNAIDGMLAREHGMKSDVGLILNELGDVLSDAALYLPFALIEGVRGGLVVVVVVLGVIGEMTGVIAVQLGTSRRYDGPFGKSDRAFLFGAIALLLGWGVPPGRWLDVTLGIAVALSALTIVNRARRALRAARDSSGPASNLSSGE